MGLLARLTRLLAHMASSVTHAPPRFIELLRPAPPHPPKVIDDPCNRRERGDAESSGGYESSYGETYRDDGGGYDGAEDEEEWGGDGEAEEGAGEDEAGEAEEGAADGEEGDDGEYLGCGGAVVVGVASQGVCVVVLRHGDGGRAVALGSEGRRGE